MKQSPNKLSTATRNRSVPRAVTLARNCGLLIGRNTAIFGTKEVQAFTNTELSVTDRQDWPIITENDSKSMDRNARMRTNSARLALQRQRLDHQNDLEPFSP